jgi:hypothetical protein
LVHKELKVVREILVVLDRQELKVLKELKAQQVT